MTLGASSPTGGEEAEDGILGGSGSGGAHSKKQCRSDFVAAIINNVQEPVKEGKNER